MYKGKHRKHVKSKRWIKSESLLVSLLLIIGVTIAGTLAYIITSTGEVENTFATSEISTQIQETVDQTTKSDVMIKNTGDTKAYIRAAVAITWQDANGNILGETPVEGTDYTIEYTDVKEQGANRWMKGTDGFYYWTSPVLSDDEDAEHCYTGVLMESCEAKESKTIGTGKDAVTYYLSVEIIGSGIQSVPTSVVAEEWKSGVSGVSDDGTLTIKQ